MTGRLSTSEPEPAEHPDPHGGGPAHPRGVHRAAGRQDRVGGLFADRAAHHGAHLGRREPAAARSREGEDIHRATAAEVFGVPLAEVDREQRRYAKVDQLRPDLRHVGVRAVAQNSTSSARPAQTYMDRYFARYPGVARTWSARARRRASSGYVETVFGRRLWLPDISSGSAGAPPGRRARRDQRADAGHRRRSDQDGDDRGAGLARRARACKTRLIMQVHDELVLEVPDAELERVKAELPELMQSVARARRAAGRRGRRRRQLGQGALAPSVRPRGARRPPRPACGQCRP